MKFLANLLKKESGQGLTEYALIISLIILVSFVAVQGFGLEVGSLYTFIADNLPF